jgi:hypothetical protein
MGCRRNNLTTVAEEWPGNKKANQLNNPQGVYVGANVYVADYSNHRIQKCQYAQPSPHKSRRNLKQKQSIKGITDLLDEDDENYFIRKKQYQCCFKFDKSHLITLTDLNEAPVTSLTSQAAISENSPTDVTLTATLSVVW